MKFSPLISAVLCSVFVVSLVPTPIFASEFPDINDSSYKESIEYVQNEGAVEGYADGTFQPGREVNRAEMAKILVSTLVKLQDIKDKKNCFNDVHTLSREWYAPYICYAKEKGIVTGYADGTFLPGNSVKMVEAYKMALKTFEVALATPTEKESWYTPYLNFIHANTTFSKFAFLNTEAMTREEMAGVMHALLLIKKGEQKIVTQKNIRSLGCGQNPPRVVPTSSVVNGITQKYITVIPSGYNKDTPLPIVFAFHGRTNSNVEVQRYYGVQQAANGKAIFVYPAGQRNATNTAFVWSEKDYALFDQLLAEFENNYCVDTDRVFVVGHSLGAWFTNSLACARGNVIRAVGTVGGGTTIANCSGPVAALVMHNPKDNLVPISDGRKARDQYIRQNSCSATSVSTEPAGLSCRKYESCGEFAPFVWCEHHEDTAYWDGSFYPHTWPRNAGREIWNFFTNVAS